MPQSYQIDYLEFPSGDGIKSRRFFHEAFGWAHTDYGPDYFTLDAVGIGTGFQSAAADVTEAPLAVIRCTDLEQAERAVALAGGVITRPAFDFPGGRRFHFREPGGSELAVYVSTEA